MSPASGSAPIAVFDLDGTLLAGDSTASWLSQLVFSSWLRGSVALVALPLCLLLIWWRASRWIGASVLLWIATVGYDQKALLESMDRFAKRFERGEVSLRWRNDGLKAMERHRSAGDRVLVVT